MSVLARRLLAMAPPEECVRGKAPLLRRHLDLGLGRALREDDDALARPPLEREAARALERVVAVDDLVVLVEGDLPDGAFHLRLLELRDEGVRVERAGALRGGGEGVRRVVRRARAVAAE